MVQFILADSFEDIYNTLAGDENLGVINCDARSIKNNKVTSPDLVFFPCIKTKSETGLSSTLNGRYYGDKSVLVANGLIYELSSKPYYRIILSENKGPMNVGTLKALGGEDDSNIELDAGKKIIVEVLSFEETEKMPGVNEEVFFESYHFPNSKGVDVIHMGKKYEMWKDNDGILHIEEIKEGTEYNLTAFKYNNNVVLKLAEKV